MFVLHVLFVNVMVHFDIIILLFLDSIFNPFVVHVQVNNSDFSYSNNFYACVNVTLGVAGHGRGNAGRNFFLN